MLILTEIGFFVIKIRHRKKTVRKWQTKLFLFGFVQAYGLAWFSHFFIEHNRPATWTYPTYSFFADFRMFYDIVTLKFPPFM